ncbi:hypothetical protein EDB92DRAFT_1099018 [Lactarius akahatsu]|uniref:CHCH domain-containing protein n=1 Tax=Lactarius akahatsu TaxID=416441 RepID=A0AAD4LBJ1_9AGAM|nr:hypothetical protein EDB92DRAFT_1099018 [Lactarius akahatsu]KAH9171345.1 hypothetical protein EDB89DRAFT_2070888 [Lactarius sanguifluus]
MPRQSRSSRPTTSRPAPAPASAPSRGASTAAYPAHHAPAPPAPAPPAHTAAPAQAQASGGPGMLAQMAATAGSVAVGSTIGHGISSMLFGGRSEAAPAEQQHQAAPQQNTSSFSANCEGQAKEFSKCIEKADLQSCSWYLEQLKACQAAASQY